MPEQDPIAHIPGTLFGRGGEWDTTERLACQTRESLLDIPSLLEATETLLSEAEYDHVANVRMGTSVCNLRALILDHAQELGIPLPMGEEDAECMDEPLCNLLAMLHDRASELAMRNWRLVPFSLRKVQSGDLFTDDVADHMCQAGFSGLLFAAKCWDPWYGVEESRGDTAYANRFSSYAVPTIAGYMKRSLAEFLPAGVDGKAFFQVWRFQRAFPILLRWFDEASEENAVRFALVWEQLGRQPVTSEFHTLARSVGVEREWRRRWRKIRRTEEALQEISPDDERRLFRRDERTGEMEETDVDPQVVFGLEVASPEELVTQQEFAREIDVILSRLSERDRGIVDRYFGFFDGRKWTFAEIGREFSVPRNTIRNRFQRILGRLRHPTLRQRLRVYLE